MLRPRMCSLVLAATTVLPLSPLVRAGPITTEEARRQDRILARLKEAIRNEATDAGKRKQIALVMKDEGAVDLRRQIMEIAIGALGHELEPFLTDVLTGDKDAGLRSQAATALGRTGSEKCLDVLARAAAQDRTTSVFVGDVGGQSSARRAATFAIAQLATRFPGLADEAADKLQSLPSLDKPGDIESLADARLQALYQVRHDKTLLAPFYKRLRSNDAAVRVRGVVAFQFLGLKRAPPEIIDALKDTSCDVRSWAAVVLGLIGDLKAAQALMRVAEDNKEETRVRGNAIWSLGQMKAPAAANLMEKLLADADLAVQSNAAVALYRITGKKVKQFPKGYRTE